MTDLHTLSENPNDFLFWDTETRALPNLTNPDWGDVTKSGAVRYSNSSFVTILTYCIGKDGPVKTWSVENFDDRLNWRDAPPELLEHIERARKGQAWLVAWNSFFDRHVSNNGIKNECGESIPILPVRCVLDAMAQAVASNLPAKLDGASQKIGRAGKIGAGKSYINLFAPADGATPQTRPEEWAKFIEYAEVDTDELRNVFFSTRPLWFFEWEQFWVSEEINDIGLPIDVDFVKRANDLSKIYLADVEKKVRQLTQNSCYSVNQHGALAKWVADRIDHLPEAHDILVKKYEEDEEGDLAVTSLSLGRDRVQKLILYLNRLDDEDGLTDDEYDVLQLLDVRLYGASATPKKFQKILPMLSAGDRLCGQYVFNGANQTGRFSSRGVQVQNLTRAYVGMEERDKNLESRAIDFIEELEETDNDPEILDEFNHEFGSPGRALSRLIRPAIHNIAWGQILVWGDWSAIEARVLPWLSKSSGGNEVLDVMRKSDKDKAEPDIYVREAAKIYGVDVVDLWEKYRSKDKDAASMRTMGKIGVLSLGFGGGHGALQGMATAYNISLSKDERSNIIDKWRENNRWAVKFWNDLWSTFLAAFNSPGAPFNVGEVVYVFQKEYMSGSMFCFLPDGRPLVYPRLKWENREREDDKGNKYTRLELTYQRGYERRSLWYGVLAENITQATAGSILRECLVNLSKSLSDPAVVIGHTHDEIIIETKGHSGVDEDVQRTRRELLSAMTTRPVWAKTLPLAAEISNNLYYTKTVG